jgi:hypothetical protein
VVAAGAGVVVAGAVETAGAAGAVGAAAIAASVGAAAGATGTSVVIGVELAASSAMWVFQAKLEIIDRNAVDEMVAVAIRARRAGCGLRVINLVIVAVISLAVIVAKVWFSR